MSGNEDRPDRGDEEPDPPGPDPARTPGLDAGGSVPPGETPPDAASASEGLSARGPAPARSAKWFWMAAVVVVAALVALFFAAMAIGLVPR